MLYIKSFKNYEEFKQVFAITKHGNGVLSRKNRILLAMLKDRRFFRWWLQTRARIEKYGSCGKEYLDSVDYLNTANMDGLKDFVRFMLYDITVSYRHISNDFSYVPGNRFKFEKIGYVMYSLNLEPDVLNGLCADGDTRAIRYANTERGNRIFKMKAGKFISKCIEEHACTAILPEQVKRWIGEEFAREWQSYAESFGCASKYTLHVNNDFESIYCGRVCRGNFHSCMEDKDYWTFYRDAVDASAACLTDEEGLIVARCVIFNEVRDFDDNVYRLAERQYSTDCDDVLKQMLVDRLIAGGYIDGYKRIGAGCNDADAFVANDGTQMSDRILYIDCRLSRNDALSYQDSFKYYNEDEGRAYNDEDGCDYCDMDLSDTDGCYHLSDDHWSDYYEKWLADDESCYDDRYDDYIPADLAVDYICNNDRKTANRERIKHDDDYCWSDYEDAYIYYDECVEVDGDYRLKNECVQDIDGDWQIEEDCVWSDYEGAYILDDDDHRVWSECKQSYLDKLNSTFCEHDSDWCPDGDAFYSELTGIFYVSESSMTAAEKAWREQHALVPVCA